MHKQSGQSALVYVAIILACYLVGLVILLLHHVKQKHGHITLYDIYLEVMPSCVTGVQVSSQGTSQMTGQDEDDTDGCEEDVHKRFSSLKTVTRFSDRARKMFRRQQSAPVTAFENALSRERREVCVMDLMAQDAILVERDSVQSDEVNRNGASLARTLYPDVNDECPKGEKAGLMETAL